MEGNDCYKFSTINHYVQQTKAPPIRLALDIGCNLGEMSHAIRQWFPAAQVFGFEPVEEYYLEACQRLADDAAVKVFHAAVTGAHLYADDLGLVPHAAPQKLQLLKGLPAAGPGWRGGSMVRPANMENPNQDHYRTLPATVTALSLDEAVQVACTLTGRSEIDYIKMDCEGCECDALGCASLETLQRIRFISGEYHEIERFYEVMRGKLYQTHYVNLVGEGWGSFFCERKGAERTILRPHREGMLELRPWLCPTPIDWHPFLPDFVLPMERFMHGLPSEENGLVQ